MASGSSNSPESWLVAHRGDRAGGVENTLTAFAEAVSAGALFAECDIQFCSDDTPVVIHDNDLKRLCNKAGMKTLALELPELIAACSASFELPTLKQLLLWLQSQPQLTMFIEIKDDILKRKTPEFTAQLLADHIPAMQLQQIVLISMAGSVLDACKARFPASLRIGWVTEGEDRPQSLLDYVFMPYDDVETMAAWQQQGVKVGLYTVNDSKLATELREHHADLIETDFYSKMRRQLDGTTQ